MSTSRDIPALLAHVQRGRLPAVPAGPTRKDIQALRPRPSLDEVVFDVPLQLIVADSPIQTRDPFDPEASDEDAALLDVVRQGLWTPPVVVRAVDAQPGDRASTYQIEDGHRRVAAHRMAGRLTIRAVIKRHDGREADLTTLRANTFKRLPPVQQAQAIARVRERHGLEYQTIAELAGLTPRYVSELMRMLDAGAEALQAVEEGRLSVREAARIGRLSVSQGKAMGKSVTSLNAATGVRLADTCESETSCSAVSPDGIHRPSAMLAPQPIPPSSLQDELNALSLLDPEKTVELFEWIQQHPMRMNQMLASALLLSTKQHLTMKEASSLAEEFLKRRTGQGIVQIMQIGVRLHRAVRAGRTSPEERDLFRRVADWLLEQ